MFTVDDDRAFNDRRFAAVEMFDERLDPAFIFQNGFHGLDTPCIGQHQAHTRIQECQFAQTMFERRDVEIDHGEGFGRWQERNRRSFLAIGIADDLKRAIGLAIMETDDVFLALAPDTQFQPFR